MKKLILSTIFYLTILSFCLAQGVSGGLRLGMNIANSSISASGITLSPDSKIGLMAGGYVTIMASAKFGIQPELVYSQMGSSLTISGQTAKTSFNYLSVPIILKYKVTKNFSLEAGPQLGILMSASGTSGSTTTDIKDQTTGADFGAAFGLGLDFGKFNAGARYYLGFSNLVKDTQGTDVKQTNNAFQLFIGYALFGK
jgi:hypothetical protein